MFFQNTACFNAEILYMEVIKGVLPLLPKPPYLRGNVSAPSVVRRNCCRITTQLQKKSGSSTQRLLGVPDLQFPIYCLLTGLLTFVVLMLWQCFIICTKQKNFGIAVYVFCHLLYRCLLFGRCCNKC